MIKELMYVGRTFNHLKSLSPGRNFVQWKNPSLLKVLHGTSDAHQIGQCKTNDALACFFIIIYIYIYSGYGKYSDPLKFFTLCYIAAIC